MLTVDLTVGLLLSSSMILYATHTLKYTDQLLQNKLQWVGWYLLSLCVVGPVGSWGSNCSSNNFILVHLLFNFFFLMYLAALVLSCSLWDHQSLVVVRELLVEACGI